MWFSQSRLCPRHLEQAVQSAPYCPLAVWDYAGALDMSGQREDALSAYRWLVKRGAENPAFGDCGEGIQSARSLVADCYYRMARLFEIKDSSIRQ
jgi:hypothetical protein